MLLALGPRTGEALLLVVFLGGVASGEKGGPGCEATPGAMVSLRRPRCTSSKWRRTLALVAKVLRHIGQDFPVGVLSVLGRPPVTVKPVITSTTRRDRMAALH